MKTNRQKKILEIREMGEIETQEELIDALQREGFNVTQATVSRDIREMKLQKIMTDSGRYKYIVQKPQGSVNGHFAYSHTLVASIISADYAMNLVVVKTYPGMAQAVAAGLDAICTRLRCRRRYLIFSCSQWFRRGAGCGGYSKDDREIIVFYYERHVTIVKEMQQNAARSVH